MTSKTDLGKLKKPWDNLGNCLEITDPMAPIIRCRFNLKTINSSNVHDHLYACTRPRSYGMAVAGSWGVPR